MPRLLILGRDATWRAAAGPQPAVGELGSGDGGRLHVRALVEQHEGTLTRATEAYPAQAALAAEQREHILACGAHADREEQQQHGEP